MGLLRFPVADSVFHFSFLHYSLLISVLYALGFDWVEGVFTFGNHQGGDAVADDVGDGTGFGHELIDAQQKGESLERNGVHGGQGGGEDNKTAACNPGGAFGSEHENTNQHSQLPPAQMHIVQLGQEYCKLPQI